MIERLEYTLTQPPPCPTNQDHLSATTADQFVSRLQHVCDITLTNDFWHVTLPNDLATSSPRSPSRFAYDAALVLLEAPVLFSHAKVAELLDPAIQANRSMVERHHLFPRAYLDKLKISDRRETNQIANYAYVEWADNTKISDQSPVEYLSQLRPRFSEAELERMYEYHALPEGWERMEYRAFLEIRREMMAQIVRKGYQTLTTGAVPEVTPKETFDLTGAIDGGESEEVEFKSTLRINLHTGESDKRMELSVLKTLAGFLNTSGGTLIVGVSDDGTPVGIEADKFPNEDKMSLHLVNVVKSRMGPTSMAAIHVHFEDYDDCRVLVARCHRSPTPVFVKDGETERFYIRTGPSTTELSASEAHNYIQSRFKH